MFTKDYAVAQGILEGDQQNWFGGEPATTLTSFHCFRELGFCFQSDVWINASGPILNPNVIVQTGPVLDGPIYSFTQWEQKIPITSWNEHEVVATIKDGECKTTATTISEKEAFQIIRYPCGGSPRFDKRIDADKYSEDRFIQKQKEAEGYYSKEYREYLKAVRAPIAQAAQSQRPPPQQ